MVWLYLQEVAWQELVGRMGDLEAEHDYLLDREAVGVASSGLELEAVGVASRLESRPALCSLLPDPGPCGSQVTRWYYLEREEDCLEFPWGGCQGNENNFLSLDQCRAACAVPADKPRPRHLSAPLRPPPRPPLVLPPPAATPYPASCQLPPDSGPCADRITRFYHEEGTCKRFQYGGCAGNANNFFTEAECQRTCGGGDDKEEGAESVGVSRPQREGRRRPPMRDVCLLPEEAGSCGGSEVRYRWDPPSGSCRQFRWSGCGGNGNNFISEEKCAKRCDGSRER